MNEAKLTSFLNRVIKLHKIIQNPETLSFDKITMQLGLATIECLVKALESNIIVSANLKLTADETEKLLETSSEHLQKDIRDNLVNIKIFIEEFSTINISLIGNIENSINRMEQTSQKLADDTNTQ